MVGHNSNEGLSFTPNNLTSDAAYNDLVAGYFPTAGDDVLSYIESTLYPPVSNNTLYSSNYGRAVQTSGDVLINCNAVAISREYGNHTYAYLFAVTPGYHSQDFVYTYYSPNSFAMANSTVGYVLQEYIVNFVANGKPTTTVPGAPDMDFYGADSQLVRLDTSGITKATDPAAKDSCSWWGLNLVS
jgi:carboxylesterase type B